jgi:hypothetical protein
MGAYINALREDGTRAELLHEIERLLTERDKLRDDLADADATIQRLNSGAELQAIMAAHNATTAERDRLRDALKKIDGTLTNMQPVIANGLLDKHQLDYVDRYVDPAVQTARAALKGDTP